jgi:pimeloyl-[acyl-carrier protein] synthase
MLAIPERDRSNLKRWSADYAIFLGGAPLLPPEVLLHCARSLAEFMRYFRELSAERRAKPASDLLSALLLASNEDTSIDQDVVSATAVLLITAGHETTTNLIGNGLLALLNQPSALDQLRNAPTLWPGALEELLRFDSPVQFVARRVASELTVREHRIPEDEVVFILTGAANRDPNASATPTAWT